MANKYLNDTGLQYFFNKLKTIFLTNVAYDSTNKKLTKTLNGTTSDIVTVATIKSAMSLAKGDVGLGNVNNTADANKTVNKANTLTTARNIEGINFDGSADASWYATCSTAAATAAKVATITPQTTNFVLKTGAKVFVKFTYANSAGSSTLNVNSTGAKPIYYNGAAIATSVTDANGTYEFVYNGDQWELVGDLDTNTTYTNVALGQGYGTCTPAEGTEWAVTLGSYALTTGGIVSVSFTNNNYISTTGNPANLKLNINSKGAKPVYHNGAAIAAGVIRGDDVVTFMYNGTNYILLAIDRGSTGITGFEAYDTLGTGLTNVTGHGLKISVGSAVFYLPFNDNSEHLLASSTYPGLMSAGQVSKLTGIENGANKTTVDSSLSSSSTNPVQNKVINTALGAKAPLASPALTGTPTAPTAAKATNTTQIATTAFVKTVVGDYAPKASPALTGTPTAPTATAGTNTTQIATTAFVKSAVDTAIAGVTQFDFEVVTSLPTTGVKGKIYLVAHSHGTGDAYDEYIWTGSAFEKIGNTDIDLSGYMLKTDMVAITTSEIDTLFA